MSGGGRDPNEILGGFAGDDAPAPRNYATEELIGADDAGRDVHEEMEWRDAAHDSDEEDALSDVLAEVEEQDPGVDAVGVASSQGGGLLGALRATLRNPGGNKGKLIGVIAAGFFVWFAAQMFGAINGDSQPDITSSWSDNDDTSLLPADDDWEATYESDASDDAGNAPDAPVYGLNDEAPGGDDGASDDHAGATPTGAAEIERLQAQQAQMEGRLADLQTSMRSIEERADTRGDGAGSLDASAIHEVLERELGGPERLERMEAMLEETGDLLRALTRRVEAIDARTHSVQAEVAELDGRRPRGRPDIDFIASATPSGCARCTPHAVIHDAGGDRRILARGDTYEGFRVEVQPDRMVLESADGQQYTYFRDY